MGNAHEIGLPGPDGSPSYRITRCIGGPEEGGKRHEGADLSCGRGGDLVRAAAHGYVVKAEAQGWNGGFGRLVVIAHRLAGGGLAYSVYAHLADQSLRVRAGQLVAAGQPIGRVGRSGRATSSHLHFEVRYIEGLDPRPWQNAEVLDPITFVSDHLPADRNDNTAAAPYLEWADCAAMLEGEDRGDSVLEREAWWRMLACAVRQPGDDLPDEADGMRKLLVGAGVVAPSVPDTSLTWGEMARDLKRLRLVGVMVPRPPVSPAAHRAECERRFGAQRPTLALDQLEKRREAPRLGPACVALADLSSSWEIAAKKPRKPQATTAARTPAAVPPGVQAGREVDGSPR